MNKLSGKVPDPPIDHRTIQCNRAAPIALHFYSSIRRICHLLIAHISSNGAGKLEAHSRRARASLRLTFVAVPFEQEGGERT